MYTVGSKTFLIFTLTKLKHFCQEECRNKRHTPGLLSRNEPAKMSLALFGNALVFLVDELAEQLSGWTSAPDAILFPTE